MLSLQWLNKNLTQNLNSVVTRLKSKPSAEPEGAPAWLRVNK